MKTESSKGFALRNIIKPVAPTGAVTTVEASEGGALAPASAVVTGTNADRILLYRARLHDRIIALWQQRTGILGLLLAPFTSRVRAVMARLQAIEEILCDILGDRAAAAQNEQLRNDLAALQAHSAAAIKNLTVDRDAQRERAERLLAALHQIHGSNALQVLSGLVSGTAKREDALAVIHAGEKLVNDALAADAAAFGHVQLGLASPPPKKPRPPRKRKPVATPPVTTAVKGD